MPNEPVNVEYTPEFKRNLRGLAKKYRHIRSDVQPVIEQIQTGQFPGDQIPGIGQTLFKVRVRNCDISKGKRAGYRLIYALPTQNYAILVTIYAKSDQADISSVQIRRILKEFKH